MLLPSAAQYADEPAKLRVALCQVSTEQWRLDDNLERVLAALREAKAQGAELAITPECVIHGYADNEGSREDYAGKMAQAAQPIDGPRMRRVRAEVTALGCDTVFGFAELAADGRIHNSAAFIARDGSIPWIYRKVHCRPSEAAWGHGVFEPGERFHVAERTYDEGKGERRFTIGAMICFDREIPETVRCLRALGSQLIACPLATWTYDLSAEITRADNELVTRARAAENEQFIVVVNHAGRYNGGSFAVGPFGEHYCQLGRGSEVRTVALPVGAVAKRFHADPLGWMGWGYRRPEVYARYLDAPPAARAPGVG